MTDTRVNQHAEKSARAPPPRAHNFPATKGRGAAGSNQWPLNIHPFASGSAPLAVDLVEQGVELGEDLLDEPGPADQDPDGQERHAVEYHVNDVEHAHAPSSSAFALRNALSCIGSLARWAATTSCGVTFPASIFAWRVANDVVFCGIIRPK